MLKNPCANAGDVGDVGSIPGWGRSPGEGNSNPLQYSCLENPMDREAWKATVHGVTGSDMTDCTILTHCFISFFLNWVMLSAYCVTVRAFPFI